MAVTIKQFNLVTTTTRSKAPTTTTIQTDSEDNSDSEDSYDEDSYKHFDNVIRKLNEDGDCLAVKDVVRGLPNDFGFIFYLRGSKNEP